MPGNKKPRKKTPTQKSKKNKEKAHQLSIEYYSLAFAHVHQYHLNDMMEISKTTRKELHQNYQNEIKQNKTLVIDGDEAWNILNNFLVRIESKIKKIIEDHSEFFWFHLYRRTSPGSIADTHEKRDTSTIASVRLTLETAFLKYAKNTANDMCLSKDISARDVLGGMFYSSLLENNYHPDMIEKYWKLHQENTQWVMKEYSPEIHQSVYLLESYAYEYWRTTAKMRAIGKGVKLLLNKDGSWKEIRTEEQDNLILSYDRRLVRGKKYLSSAKGLPSFRDIKEDFFQSSFLGMRYNYDRYKFIDIFHAESPLSNEITNFIPLPVDFKSFIRSHKSLKKPFLKRMGFSLETFFSFLQALSYNHILYRTSKLQNDENSALKVWSIMQRAYSTTSFTLEELSHNIVQTLKSFPGKKYQEQNLTSEEILKACESFTLNQSTKERLSLWSFGPRPVIFPYNDIFIIDLGGVQTILENLFFGMRENNQERGLDFENILRDEISTQGYELLPVRNLTRPDGKYRETDLAIRIGNTLILCDCRSTERPLDWIIGKPSVLKIRNDLMQDKINQVLSIKHFACENLQKLNGDFSWVTDVVSLGVVTDIEWIDSLEDQLWLDKKNDLPVLMSAQELLDLLEKMTLALSVSSDSENPIL